MNRWAALDPGRSKCGLVLVDFDQRVVDVGLVIPPETVAATLRRWNSPIRADRNCRRRWHQQRSLDQGAPCRRTGAQR